MSVKRIKNIVIASLLLVNLIFLSIVITDAATERREARDAKNGLTSLFCTAGITLDADETSQDVEIFTPVAARSTETEARIAEAILGNTVFTDHGGSIYNYAGETGQAVFRSGGEFEITLDGDGESLGNVEKAVKKLLKDTGVPAEILSSEKTGGGTTVTAVCTYGRARIFNCVVTFMFDGDMRLVSIDGRLAAGDFDGGGDAVSAAPATALMDFLGFVREGRASCLHVYSVDIGYVMSVTPFGEGQLSPTWVIDTDSGPYYIDARTGDMLTGME